MIEQLLTEPTSTRENVVLEAWQVERIEAAYDRLEKATRLIDEAFRKNRSSVMDVYSELSGAQHELACARGILSGHFGFSLHKLPKKEATV